MSIYKLTSNQTNNIYIGSTTRKLTVRFNEHYSRFNKGYLKSSSRELLQYSDCKIELLESDILTNLKQRERHYIETLPDCINKVIPGRNQKESKKLWEKSKINCPFCNKELTKKYKQRHIKEYCLENKNKVL
jgi:predicted GIY-YIG superfamily endonuclease